MGNVVNIQDYMQEPDLESMDTSELETYLAQLRRQIEELDDREPANMNSEAYEQWADAHEELEDLVDEVLDLLDERRQ